MYRLSFKIKHRNCAETAFSLAFPSYHITVFDIQSQNARRKQYVYYIHGTSKMFDVMLEYLKPSKSYTFVQELERTSESLVLLVVLHQKSYVQNVIQKHHGFLLEGHTVYGGFEFWHIGSTERKSIDLMLTEFKELGELHVLYIGSTEFSHPLLSKQQKKIIQCAYDLGYYELPRKTTVAKIAKAVKLNHATVGEHLLKAENRLLEQAIKKL